MAFFFFGISCIGAFEHVGMPFFTRHASITSFEFLSVLLDWKLLGAPGSRIPRTECVFYMCPSESVMCPSCGCYLVTFRFAVIHWDETGNQGFVSEAKTGGCFFTWAHPLQIRDLGVPPFAVTTHPKPRAGELGGSSHLVVRITPMYTP